MIEIEEIMDDEDSSSAAINPFMAVITENATEAYGNCFGFSLVYSSSFVLKAEISPDGTAVVSGGINDFDFKWNNEHNTIYITAKHQ